MKSVFLLLSCLVLASAVKPAEANHKADAQKHEDGLLKKVVNEDPTGTVRDEEVNHKEGLLNMANEDPTGTASDEKTKKGPFGGTTGDEKVTKQLSEGTATERIDDEKAPTDNENEKIVKKGLSQGKNSGEKTSMDYGNECSNYRILDDYKRAQGYSDLYKNNYRCDRYKISYFRKWYRFQGNAGKQMPEHCVPKNHCGAHAPGWLRGSHPTVADGAVHRTVCFHWKKKIGLGDDCCRWNASIRVRNCGNFYIYQLEKPPTCYLRYCGNQGKVTTPSPTPPSECSNYRILDDYKRAQGYSDLYSNNYRCDRYNMSILSRWYRFQGNAGEQMPEHCVTKNHCGAHAPGWLSGSHPTVADGVVWRKVCFHWKKRIGVGDDCCRWRTNIRVRNCGNFYIYKLHKPPTCYLRYCGNGEGESTPTHPHVTAPSLPPPHPEVNVTCGKDEMSISIPKKLLHGLDREHIRLSDLKCGATETSTHFTLHTHLTECGTVSRHTKKFVVYSNKVEEIPIEHHQIITRIREVEIPFVCYYSNMGVVSAVGLQVESKKIVFSKKGYGKFVLEMKIYPDGSFRHEYRKKDYPVIVKLRKRLFVEVSIDTEDERLSILAETCWATPESDPFNNDLIYTFIKDGCAVDDTVVPIPTADKHTERFSIEAFNFIGDHQFVFMHCKVKVCNASDPHSRCAQGCIDRKKRSLMTQETKDEEHNMSQGPFVRDDEDETQKEETMKDMRDVEKSGKFPSMVAAMAVVAAVCVMGVSYFAWNQRKQRVLHNYQRLTVPADD